MEKKRLITAWVALIATLLAAVGIIWGLSSSSSDSQSAPLSVPATAESVRADRIVQEYTTSNQAPLLVVLTRQDGKNITPDDKAQGFAAYQRMLAVDRKVPAQEGAPGGAQKMPPLLPSKDGKALLFFVPVTTNSTGLNLSAIVDEVRAAAQKGLPDSLSLHTTGGPAFGADSANTFKGANFKLLALTAAVVAVLLLLTYRSPILWIVPLVIVAVADRVAALVAAAVLEANGMVYDGSTSGIVSVLVFGAGTNYALLLTSRYRDELRLTADKREALFTAFKGSIPSIVASNITVLAAMLILLSSDQPAIKNLGAGAPIGLLIALFATLTTLPAAYYLLPRGIFWPFIPRPENAKEDSKVEPASEEAPVNDPAPTGRWHSIATWVSNHATGVLVAGTALLVLLSCGMIGGNYGLSQDQQFTTTTESIEGLHILEEHYPAGFAAGITVLAPRDMDPQQLQGDLRSVKGVKTITPQPLDNNTKWQRWQVFTNYAPGTPEALNAVRDMRAATPDTVLIGGQDAQAVDKDTAAKHDLKLLLPLILLVVFILLVVVLRALVAPVLMILTTTLSALAAYGMGVFASHYIFHFPAVEWSVPIYSFLFLVALGVDYSIFLVMRARQMVPQYGTREAMIRAVSYTGGVITSAGIVLAAVFVTLGVLPLVVMAQCGIIVSLGVLLDTFLVRTMLVPALFAKVGDTMWWPSHLALDK